MNGTTMNRTTAPSGTRTLPFVFLTLVFSTLTLTAQQSLAQSGEEAALKAVIRAETSAFLERDAQAWQSTWLHDAQVTRTLVASSSYSTATGWANFGPAVMTDIRNNPEPIPLEFTNENFIIHVGGNVAGVVYDQTMRAPSADPSFVARTREHRTLVKKADQWKIVSQVTHDTETFGTSPQAIEESLNTIGYNLLEAKKVQEAIAVFTLNVRLHPQSWNVYDSLGEAFASAGNTKLAIKNYKKSLELNLESASGKRALAQLRKKTAEE